MRGSSLSRRNFIGSLLASTAAFPLRRFTWTPAGTFFSPQEKAIKWGYPENAVRLDSNENPMGPSPQALKAMEKGLSQAHRYTSANQLRNELASFHSISKDMILAGCGSTEMLRITPWAFLRQKGEVVTALHTYQTLLRECKKIDAKVIFRPLDKNFSFDLESLRNAISASTKMVYLVNPNNPTGTCLDFEDIEKFCAALPKEILVFIDEAYSHFLGDEKQRDGITLVKKGYNVIVTRTFSKVYGLAGMRLGYAVSRPNLIKELQTFGFRDMGINQAVYAGALACLDDEKHIRAYKNLIEEGQDHFSRQFDTMGLESIPAKTPFIMVKLKGIPSKAAQKKLADRNVYVRKGEDWFMPGYLRISIGFPEENQACVAALEQILS